MLDLEALAEISSNPAGLETKTATPANQGKTKTKDMPEGGGGGGGGETLNEYFSKFMAFLLELFKKDRQLLEPDERGYFIIR